MSAVVDKLQGAHQAWWTPELMPRVVRLHSSAHLIVLSARTQQADAYNKKLDPESMTQSALYMRLADAKPHDVLKSAPDRWRVARIPTWDSCRPIVGRPKFSPRLMARLTTTQPPPTP